MAAGLGDRVRRLYVQRGWSPNRGYILEKGLIQFEGTMESIWENEPILSKYLAV